MKISYFLGTHKGGTHRHTNNLINTVEGMGMKTTFDVFPPPAFRGYIPPMLGKRLKRKHHDSDIYHCGGNGGFVLKTKSKPLVVTVFHLVFGSNYQKYTSLSQKAYYLLVKSYFKKTFRSADKIVAISHSVASKLHDHFGITDARVIYPGIDTERFKSQQTNQVSDNIKLLFVGNLIRRKGVDLLPKILERLGDRFRLFYTTTNGEKRFSQPNMVPLNYLNEKDLVEVYNECDILLFPSRLEGFGYAVAEAMACEKPVVATNCSSLPELVIDGKGGFLCEMDNVDDFVEKIKILAADKRLREKMGKFNRKRVLEKFTLDRMAGEYLELYRKLLKENNK